MYIVPLTSSLLEKSLAAFNAQFTGQYLSSLGTNATAFATIARAPVTVSQPFSFIAYNLRPFTKPVSSALLLVGNIYISALPQSFCNTSDVALTCPSVAKRFSHLS